MIIEEEIYLEHHGVKGQRWGVRRRRGGTPEQRKAGTRKFARNLAVASAIGIAGGLAAGRILSGSGRIPVRELQRSQASLFGMGESFLRSRPPAFMAIPLGPIGSTGIARLGGAIPLGR